MKRRKFLAGSAAAGVMLVSKVWAITPLASCTRKSIIDLEPGAPEVIAYERAVSIMKSLRRTDPRSWECQAHTHWAYCPHTNWWFLPWHRVYLHYFEQICRDVLQRADFALPYWDWTRYPYLPDVFLNQSSSLWCDGRNQGGTVAVQLGAVWKPVINSILRDPALSQIYSGKTASDNQKAPSVSGTLEGGPHGAVHSAVGGFMVSMFSPLDPIFWLHHCNVDRLWESWAQLHNWAVFEDKLWTDHLLNQFYDPVSRQSVSVRCAQTQNSALFGAKYDRLEVLTGYESSTGLPTLQVLFGPGEEISLPPEVKTKLQAQFTLEVPGTTDNRTVLRLAIPQDLDQLLDRIGDTWRPESIQKLPMAFLLLHQLPVPKSPSAILRVFINVPDASVETPLDDPGYVATISFFGSSDHATATPAADFAINISRNLARLAAAGRKSKQVLQLSLLSIDLQNPGCSTLSRVVQAKIRIVALE